MPFLLIDKPQGITSHDVVDRVRRITDERTVGHAGTLDPFATGLLILGITRESTKHLSEFLGLDKSYDATFFLGATSTTLDPEGEISYGATVNLSRDLLEQAMNTFLGTQEQMPPMHSAIKIGGKKLYELARKGVEIDRPTRTVTIHDFSLLSKDIPPLTPCGIDVSITCSSGTYIRAIARDLAKALGTVGYVTTLRRTTIGACSVSNAVSLENLTPTTWKIFAHSLESLR